MSLTDGQHQKSNRKMKFLKKLVTVASQAHIKNMKKDECPASKNVVLNWKNLQKTKKTKKKRDSKGLKEDAKKGLFLISRVNMIYTNYDSYAGTRK